ncbi:cysteine-rich receptor-like protein kinase 3 isoform X2 [Diospyros lotus]|uniref:cysteine-rich receptor-like protein kinase 3 isoform X2 n=1 Tax=Diospyros lotus TaxID=55363 RepID=UPI00224D5CF7|nr:cysteine-rich receptor-like protein kinase 3 isoform X2 [Diospyros lotus]
MGFGVLLCLLISLFFSVKPSLSDPRATMPQGGLVCSNTSASPSDRQVFVTNFVAALDSLTSLISAEKYGAVVNGSGNTTVYAFGECMKDLFRTDCNLCFAQIKTQIIRCLPFQRLIRGGRLFYDGCYVRYDDYMFFNESLSSVDKISCAFNDSAGNGTLFRVNVVDLMKNLSAEAPKSDGFIVGSVSRGNLSVYGLAQCWEFVNGSACDKCLANAVNRIGSCLPKEEGRVLNAGCYLRYSTQKFYNNSSPDPVPKVGGGNRRLAVILASTFSAIAFLLIVAAISFVTRKKIAKKRRERKQLGALLLTVNNSKLNFSYETLEKATNYFHNSNKLGQGGSGSVFKGILPDGRTVAIKRLFFNTRQWVDHFFNEVNLISGIDHKNLVKLLGCSITGPESLLVYEFVPNQSLNDHLSARNDLRPLNWEERYNIILGIAEGLAHLHEESKLRIIHRDIKLCNILLDEDCTPKIADFGLARLFPEDKSHISTAVAGTLGYMAPEYIVRGKLTEKVWNLYGTGRLREVVDASLRGEFEEEEANRVLQIGLLCVQATAETRPSMSMVVTMLRDDHEIPQPTQPPFLNNSSAEIARHKHSGPSHSQPESYSQSSGNTISESFIEPR